MYTSSITKTRSNIEIYNLIILYNNFANEENIFLTLLAHLELLAIRDFSKYLTLLYMQYFFLIFIAQIFSIFIPQI